MKDKRYIDSDSLYNIWNDVKKNTNKNGKPLFCKDGQIWWCRIGLNVGSEQNSYNRSFSRPVLVLKVFSKNTFIGVPITSRTRSNYEKYFNIDSLSLGGLRGSIILSQSRNFDSRRLIRLIAKIDKTHLVNIKRAFISII